VPDREAGCIMSSVIKFPKNLPASAQRRSESGAPQPIELQSLVESPFHKLQSEIRGALILIELAMYHLRELLADDCGDPEFKRNLSDRLTAIDQLLDSARSEARKLASLGKPVLW
jgi:hypothetical protein